MRLDCKSALRRFALISLLLGALNVAQSLIAAESFDGFPFAPGLDPFLESAIDLRSLNEKFAGEHGFIAARGETFIHTANQEAVRFWAVNGPPGELRGAALNHCARRLAKYGVNLVRMHGAMFDAKGEPDMKKVARTQEAVAALKAQGIYSHFSIYFPLWLTPTADHAWLKGYDGKKHPFASLMFNPVFQEHYRAWWRALLLTPSADGKKLIDEPAVFGLELQNEDSFFFWTFNPDQIPRTQLEMLETQFAEWAKAKYGSIDATLTKWKGQKVKGDEAAAGRLGFRPLWNIAHEKSSRDRDTAQFLLETQRRFYTETISFLRSLGFKGLITPSNWVTASPEVLGPLEKWSYTVGDFIDRHGYFSVMHKGEGSEWSIRNGHTYTDRSALRFDAATAGKPKDFTHPSMDITYDNKPSMISETTWNRPNRYRSEAPLYYACYGALQGTDAIVHFALDGANWSVKPGFWMQPWTLMSPSQMGQFPAAALIFRRGLVKTGDTLATLQLNPQSLLELKGTALPQDASFDELRMKDVPQGNNITPGQRVDPLIHYAGRTSVSFIGASNSTQIRDLRALINHEAKWVRSSTHELTLDYGKGLLTLNAPAAQGASGNLKSAGTISSADLTLQSELENMHIVVVSLDAAPLGRSRRMLVQAVSEEQPSDFADEPTENGARKITNIGHDPWLVKRMQGSIQFKGSGLLKIQPLDLNGYPSGASTQGNELKLRPESIYYLVTREP